MEKGHERELSRHARTLNNLLEKIHKMKNTGVESKFAAKEADHEINEWSDGLERDALA